MRALEQANRVRLARAELKRQIADGELSVADVVLECPWEAESMTIADLLMSQHRWGRTRCRRFLLPIPMVGDQDDRIDDRAPARALAARLRGETIAESTRSPSRRARDERPRLEAPAARRSLRGRAAGAGEAGPRVAISTT